MMRKSNNLLPIFELTIPFRRSKDYQRLVAFIVFLAMISLWKSSCPGWLACCISLGLFFYGINLLCLARPYREYCTLQYQSYAWYLHQKNAEILRFETVSIQYDIGLILRLELKNKDRTCLLILFQDQLTSEERRSLYLLQLSQFKSDKK